MKYNTKTITYIALCTSLITIGAFIRVPISAIPITLQVLAILFVGFVMPKDISIRSILLYVFMGLIGLPVFAQGGGIAYVLQPSFGYLMGFVVAVVWIANMKEKISHIFIGLLALFFIYVIGIIYFYLLQRFYFGKSFTLLWIFQSLILVYLPGDLISLIVVLVVEKRLTWFKG